MVGLTIAYLLVALLAVSLFPGLLLARRWGGSAAERVGVAVGVSNILLYLAAWGIFVSGVPWTTAAYAVTAVCLLLGAVAWRSVVEIARDREARQLVAAWVAVVVWGMLLTAVIRHYGGGWTGDWLEHYDRAVFFLKRQPPDTIMFPHYAVPARPPMMNVIEALFMAQGGGGFDAYEIASAFLNAMILWPVLLLASDWAGSRRNVVWIGAAVVALNPWFVQNATYPWTKLYSTYFVLLAVWAYLNRDGEGEARRVWRVVLAFLFLTAGVLVHYSAAIYAPFVGLAWAWDVVRRRGVKGWREVVRAVACSAALMLTWLAWSWGTYGFRGTVATNTTVVESKQPWDERRAIYRENFTASIVPRALLSPEARWQGVEGQGSEWGKVRDYVFLLYEPSLLFSWGAGGAVAMGWVMWRAFGKARRARQLVEDPAGPTPNPHPIPSTSHLRWEPAESRARGTEEGDHLAHRPPGPRTDMAFWIGFVVWGYVVGCLVCTPPSWWFGGIAMVILQPVMWVGMARLVAETGRMPAWVRAAWAVGLCVDAAWIVLHFYLQTWTFSFVEVNGRWEPAPGTVTLFRTAMANYRLGELHGLVFLGARLEPWAGALMAAVMAGALVWIGVALRGLAGRRTLLPDRR